MGYSPWGRKDLDMTEHAHTHTIKCMGNVKCLNENHSCGVLCMPLICSVPQFLFCKSGLIRVFTSQRILRN